MVATLFFVASLAYLFIGKQVNPMTVVAPKTQIILSAISVTIGATLVWLLISFLFGRIYCSTVCPVGTITDIFARLGRKLPRRAKAYSYRPASTWGRHVLLVYILCLLVGVMVVPYVIEPWNIMRNIAATVRPEETLKHTWIHLGIGAGTGIIAGITGIVLIIAWSVWKGRDYCTDFCPIGIALGAIDDRSLMHIEIDPNLCTSCGKCEDACSAHCIRVSERLVDNSRCLRCFDCLAQCDNDAIRYQTNRNFRITPMMRKRRSI